MNTDKEFITDRLTRNEQLIGYEVQDNTGDKFGRVHHMWADESGEPQFLGVTAGWLFERHYIIPVKGAEVNDHRRTIRVPFSSDQIKQAPDFQEMDDMSLDDRERIFRYYGTSFGLPPSAPPPAILASETTAVQQEHMRDEANIRLKQEELRVGKREVEARGVRLRKIVRTEQVSQPVDLKREDVVIERKPASGPVSGDARFENEDIFIPLRREEAVVEKQAHVTEEVRVGKRAEYDRQEVTEQVRKEELNVEKNVPRDR